MARGSERETHWFLPAALALAAGAVILALGRGGADALWIDELTSLDFARRFAESPLVLAAWCGGADVHPPGYYGLLGAWGLFAGLGEVSARALSALLAGAAVLATARLGRRVDGPLSGLAAATLLALLPAWQHYAVEVRATPLLLALVPATADALLGALEGGRRARAWTAWLAALLTGGLWADYPAALVLAPLVVAGLLSRGVTAPVRWRVAAAAAVAIGLFAAWLPAVLYQRFDLPAGFFAHLSGGPSVATVLAAVGPGGGIPLYAVAVGVGIAWGLLLLAAALRLAVSPPSVEDAPLAARGRGPGRRSAAALVLGAGLAALGPTVFVAVLPLPKVVAARYETWLPLATGAGFLAVAATAGLAWLGARRGTRPRSPSGVLAAATLGALALVVLASATGPFLVVRAVLPLAPLPVVLLVVAARRWSGRAFAVVTLATAALATASLLGRPVIAPRPDARAVVQGIVAAAPAPDAPTVGPILVFPRWEQPALAHYAPSLDVRGLETLDDVGPALSGAPRVTVVLARWAVPLFALVEDTLWQGLGGVGRADGAGRATGYRWVTIGR